MNQRRNIEDIIGLKVEVYFNLHKKLFSVRHKGLVYGHLPHLIISNAKFIVRENGRQKVLAKKQKNVHAFVRGILIETPQQTTGLKQGKCFTYNPYKHNAFYDKSVYEQQQSFESITESKKNILLTGKESYEILEA